MANENVAILSVVAQIDEKSVKKAVEAVNKTMEDVELNLGGINFEKELVDQYTSALETLKKKSKQINLSGFQGKFLETLFNSSDAESASNALKEYIDTLQDLIQLTKSKGYQQNMFDNLSTKNLEDLIIKHKELINARKELNSLGEKGNQKEIKARAIEGRSINELLQSYENLDDYKKSRKDAVSNDKINDIKKEIDLNKELSKEQDEEVIRYSKLLSLYKEMANAENKPAKGTEERIKYNKELLSIVKEIHDTEKRLSEFSNNSNGYRAKLANESEKNIYKDISSVDVFSAKYIDQYVTAYINHLKAVLTEQIESLDAKFVETLNKMAVKGAERAEKISEKSTGGKSSGSTAGTNSADDSIKKYIDDVQDLETALKKIKELTRKPFVTASFNEEKHIDDLKDLIGYTQQYIELYKKKNNIESLDDDQINQILKDELGFTNKPMNRFLGKLGNETLNEKYRPMIESLKKSIIEANIAKEELFDDAGGSGGGSGFFQSKEEAEALLETLTKINQVIDTLNEKIEALNKSTDNEYAKQLLEEKDTLEKTFADIAINFGDDLSIAIDDFIEGLKQVDNQDWNFPKLKESLLNIVEQFKNSLATVNFSSTQLDEVYQMIKGWNDASNIFAKSGKEDSERAAFLGRKSGKISNSYLFDKEDSFSGEIFKKLIDSSTDLNNQFNEAYDTWVHSHPLRTLENGQKRLGSDIGFSKGDFGVYIEEVFEKGISNMMVVNNGKYSNIDWTGIVDKEVLNRVKEIFSKSNIYDAEGLLKSDLYKTDNNFYDLDKKSELMRTEFIKAMKEAGIEDAESRYTSGSIEDLKVDMSEFKADEEKAKQEAEEFFAVLKKIADVLEEINTNGFKFTQGEGSTDSTALTKLQQELDGVKNKLDETETKYEEVIAKNKEMQQQLENADSGNNGVADPKKVELTPDASNFKSEADTALGQIPLEKKVELKPVLSKDFSSTSIDKDDLKIEDQNKDLERQQFLYDNIIKNLTEYLSLQDKIKAGNKSIVATYDGDRSNLIYDSDIRKQTGRVSQNSVKHQLDNYLHALNTPDIYNEESINHQKERLAAYVYNLNDAEKAAEIFGKKNKELYAEIIQMIEKATIAQEAYEQSQLNLKAAKNNIFDLSDKQSWKLGESNEFERLLDTEGVESALKYVTEILGFKIPESADKAKTALQEVDDELKDDSDKKPFTIEVFPEINDLEWTKAIRKKIGEINETNTNEFNISLSPTLIEKFVNNTQGLISKLSDNPEIPLSPALIETFVTDTQNLIDALLQTSKVDVELTPNLSGSLKLEDTNFENENAQLRSLITSLQMVKDLIGKKNAAFIQEGKIVNSVIPEETNKIGKLVSALTHVLDKVIAISEAIGSINFSNFKTLEGITVVKDDTEKTDNQKPKKQSGSKKPKEDTSTPPSNEDKANALLNKELDTLERIRNLELERDKRYLKGLDTQAIEEKINKEKEYIAELEKELENYKQTEVYKNKDSTIQNKKNDLYFDYQHKVSPKTLSYEAAEEEAWAIEQTNAYDKLDSRIKEYGELRKNIAKRNVEATEEEQNKVAELKTEIENLFKEIKDKDLFDAERDIKSNTAFNKENKFFEQAENDKNLERVNVLYTQLLKTKRELKDLERKGTDNLTEDERARLVKLTEEHAVIQEKVNNELAQEYTQTEKIKEARERLQELNNTKLYDINTTEVVDVNTAWEEAEKINNALNKTKANMEEIFHMGNTDLFRTSFSGAESEINDLNNQLKSGSINLKEYNSKIKEIQLNLKKKANTIAFIEPGNIEQANKLMKEYANEISGGKYEIVGFNKEIGKMVIKFEDADGQLQKVTLSVNKAKNAINQTFGSPQKSFTWLEEFLNGLPKKFADLGRYLMTFVGFHEFINTIRNGIRYVVEFDTAMTELIKVSNDSEKALRAFGDESFRIADQVASTGSEVTQAAADWSRLGYSIKEASELSKNSAIYVNVGDGIDVETATSDLVSAMKAFDIEAENSISIVDKYNQVANNFAISSAGIGEAMARSSAALAMAGNSIDQSIAMATAMNEILQDESTVGQTLKTLSLRLRGAKTELEEAGESTDGMAESTSKLREKVLALTNVNGKGGFDIMLNDKEFKSTYDIVKGIAEVWENIDDIDQAALLELLSGKTRAQGMAALLTNFEQAENALKESLGAEGSALRENEKYMDSIQGKINQVKNSWQELWTTGIDEDIVKGVLDLAKGFLDLANNAGLVKTAMAGLGAVVGTVIGYKTKDGGGRAKNFVAISKLITHRSLINICLPYYIY